VKLTKQEFKALQEEWYKKAKDSGFKDIEYIIGNIESLKESSSNCYRNEPNVRIQNKEEYFTRLTHIVEDPNTTYAHLENKIIMMRHSEGAKIKDIRTELQLLGVNKDRKSIRLIIRRHEDKWNLKHKK